MLRLFVGMAIFINCAGMATNTMSTKFLLAPTLHTGGPSSSQVRCSDSTSTFRAFKALEGKLVAKQIMKETAAEISRMKDAIGVVPGLAGIHFGNQNKKDFGCFLRAKKRACESVGINYFDFNLPNNSTLEDIITLISILNNDHSVHGIFLRLPLPQRLHGRLRHQIIFDAISREKNVDDVLHFHLAHRRGSEKERLFVPCVARGCLALLHSYNINIQGKRVFYILGHNDARTYGADFRTGLAIANLLRDENAAQVYVYWGKSNQSILENADIIISALGDNKVLEDYPMKAGVVVIDVGYNPERDTRSRGGFRILGDAKGGDPDDPCWIRFIASACSPVPGGIGPVAIAMLLSNTLMAAKLIHSFSSH